MSNGYWIDCGGHTQFVKLEDDSMQKRIEKLEAELDALKTEASRPQGFKVWEPVKDAVYYKAGIVHPNFGYSDTNNNTQTDRIAFTRGLAFRTQESAARVGRWLAVLGKLANLAIQMNEGKIFSYEYWCIYSERMGVKVGRFEITTDRPRFHSREAAEAALALLTPEEVRVLSEGIA